MSADSVLHALAEITAASSAAVLIVAALRKPIRRIAGARIAYWLWFTVPTSVLALKFPAPSHLPQAFPLSFGNSLSDAARPALITTSTAIGRSGRYAALALVIWLSGAFLMTLWLVYRQRAFTRSLGRVTAGTDGVLRSGFVTAPMLIGSWRPRVVVPADFETRYPEDYRVLMLAHERAHRERRDPLVNSIATVSLCLFWFNPVMYWAVDRLRFDQELACDALVVSRSETSKKRYADALLDAQLVSEMARWVPIGCHWRSGHPLKERITMLKLASPGLSRRLCGIAFNIVLIASSMSGVSLCLAQAPVAASPLARQSSNCAVSTAKKFSIDAEDTGVRAILRMIARKGDTNIVVTDQVHGKMTLHLKNVTWHEALKLVALSQGLVTRQSGDITIVRVPH